ncbi:MAG: hypothetical protein DSM106950_00585 [Stigonema ocellatum SAG 48.90 = DSM 106950]|nr:hypothetical protein [Stigonema ocellatum SAG 48.90 = DSM 106950]
MIEHYNPRFVGEAIALKVVNWMESVMAIIRKMPNRTSLFTIHSEIAVAFSVLNRQWLRYHW